MHKEQYVKADEAGNEPGVSHQEQSPSKAYSTALEYLTLYMHGSKMMTARAVKYSSLSRVNFDALVAVMPNTNCVVLLPKVTTKVYRADV